MGLTKYFYNFFRSSESSGVLLLLCVVVSLLVANSSMAAGFQQLLEAPLGAYSVQLWINDFLMAIFFLMVGLEIKREMVEGELSSFKSALLPIVAAVGGMLVPALIYAGFNRETEYVNGWGIPMATDIAFSLAVISMLGSRVPSAVKIFLTALAIVDDLGAILVIALFYSEGVDWLYLAISAGILGFLLLLNRMGVTKIIFYLLPGIALWYCMHHSGIHATIAGVLLAFTIPTNVSTTEISPLEKLEHQLHMPVNFLIMPIFALANTNITFQNGMVEGLFSTLGMGIILGLMVGKPLGIALFSWLAVKLKVASLPERTTWIQMIAAGMLAGIGFTMSIFIALLSFKGHPDLQDEAKFAVLIASVLAGMGGYLLLKNSRKRRAKNLKTVP